MTRVFALTCEFGEALGWDNISLERGCREHDIDDDWWFAINPHNGARHCSRGALVPAQSIYFEFNRRSAGCVSCEGGPIIAGAVANEARLADALTLAIMARGGI